MKTEKKSNSVFLCNIRERVGFAKCGSRPRKFSALEFWEGITSIERTGWDSCSRTIFGPSSNNSTSQIEWAFPVAYLMENLPTLGAPADFVPDTQKPRWASRMEFATHGRFLALPTTSLF